MAAALFTRVKLRTVDPQTPDSPRVGDVLRTQTGRMYEIHEVRGKQYVCMVIPADARLGKSARVFDWQWVKR